MNEDINKFEPFFGCWYLGELIGEGSYGKVYKIKRETFGEEQYSALKVIMIPQNDAELKQVYNEGMDDVSVTSYFESIVKNVASEISMMVRFKGNTNIVSYEDHQIIPNENGIGATILIRMELLKNLNDVINSESPQKKEVIRLGMDICRALEKCHANHVIHRDIKPENIFVNDDGDYKLGDFGIARQLEKTMSGLSKKGTFSYMAPEVYLGRAYNATVDVYSLGIVMYRLLNNNRTPFLPPYPAPISFNEKCDAQNRRMAGEDIPAPVNADDKLAQIVLKACAYNPADRFKSPTQMREALKSVAESEASGMPSSRVAATANETAESGYWEQASGGGRAEDLINSSDATVTFVESDMTEILFEESQGFDAGNTEERSVDGTQSIVAQGEDGYSLTATEDVKAERKDIEPSAYGNNNRTYSINTLSGCEAPKNTLQRKTRSISIAVALGLLITIIVVAVAINSNKAELFTVQPNTKAGDLVIFGNYEQDNNLSNGKEPIAWRVLAVENGKTLLLAEKILDAKPYNIEYKEVTWETCTLRAWLNNEFYNEAFNAGEKAKILTTRVANGDHPKLGTDGGNDTDDKLFLLSYSEVMNPAYGFSSDFGEDPARQAQGTDFANSNGLWVNKDSPYLGNGRWWLRTPGGNQNYACSVYTDGYVYYYDNVSNTDIGVRPALWVNL